MKCDVGPGVVFIIRILSFISLIKRIEAFCVLFHSFYTFLKYASGIQHFGRILLI
jgi:hypothetical protein